MRRCSLAGGTAWRLLVTSLGVALAAGTAAGSAGSGAHREAALPGGPAPKALVGRYRARFTLDEFRRAPDPRSVPSEDSTQELVIFNTSVSGRPELGIHGADGKSGGPPIRFGVKGTRIYLSCLGNNGRPITTYGAYTWARRAKLLTLKKVRDPCRGRYDRNRAFLLTTHIWRKVANR